VIAIIGILLGLMAAAVQEVRSAAARVQCQNNLKQIGLAAHLYHNDAGRLPPGVSPPPSLASSLVFLLPYLEQVNRYYRFDFREDVSTGPGSAAGREGDVPLFLCPSEPDSSQVTEDVGGTARPLGRTNYYANLGSHAWWANPDPTTGGAFYFNSAVRLTDITDGTSNTALYAEVRRSSYPNNVNGVIIGELDIQVWQATPWHDVSPFVCNKPNNIPFYTLARYTTLGHMYYQGRFWTCFYNHTAPPNFTGQDCMRADLDRGHLASRSYHRGGVNVAFADGSVHFIGSSISLDTWRALGTRGGGEVCAADY
jgi:prepilin-type processing-associated H-X9-DG protein